MWTIIITSEIISDKARPALSYAQSREGGGAIRCRKRLGGLLKYSERGAHGALGKGGARPMA
jgi:hypothetical protein